ncbi:MAG: hypothetical protein FH762_14315 [Firmicutes bacterium]|nr:hypothetical protein [Bacillota bacterium]
MLNIYCWKCGSKINEDNILGLGHFDQNLGKYKGKGFVAFNCPDCKKTRYQVIDSISIQNQIKNSINESSSDFINIDQVIDFYGQLQEISTINTFLEKCESSQKTISTEIKKPILQPLDVYNLFHELNSANMKRLMILTMDKDNYLISWELLGEGLSKPISFDPKIIFHTPFLLNNQVSVIIAQNTNKHFTQPTQKDILLTKRLLKAGKILGVEFLDHIIIEENGYHSFDQLNYI